MKTLKNSVFEIAAALVAVAIFLSTPSSHAASHRKLPSFVRVLSYNEVTRLPKAKREAYIRGLRAMMKEIDRLPKKLRSANEQSHYSQIATLLSLFAVSEAHAETRPTGVPYLSERGNVTCGPGYNARTPVPRRVGVNTTSSDPKFYVCMVGGRQTKKCGDGLIGVRQDADGSFECATVKSFTLLSDMMKSNARHVRHVSSWLDSSNKNFIGGYPTAEEYSKRARAAKQPHLQIVVVDPSEMPARQPDPVQARIIAERDAKRAADARLAAARAQTGRTSSAGASRDAEARSRTAAAPAASAPAAETAAAPAPVAADVRERTNYEAVDNDGSGAIVVTPVVQREQLTGGPEFTDEEEGASTQASSQFGSCQPETEKTCDAEEIETARQQYARDPNPDCIYAGSISKYQDGQKRAYKCVAPTQFCYSSATCSRADGERMTPDYSCESNQVICNPLIFGVQSDGKSPFCIEKGADATASCDEASKADEGAVTPLDQEHAGLKEAWNDFSDHLFKLCNQNKIAAALHCAECDIITKRLFALNIAARSVESCGAAIKFEDSQCDAEGKCQGLPGQRGTGGSRGSRSVTDGGTKRFEIRGDREISSVTDEPVKADVKSMSDVKPKPVESVFNTPTSRPK